jgi:hypothetical protein
VGAFGGKREWLVVRMEGSEEIEMGGAQESGEVRYGRIPRILNGELDVTFSLGWAVFGLFV